MSISREPNAPFVFYITARRAVLPPGAYYTPFSLASSTKRMLPPSTGYMHAFYDENRDPCSDPQQAVYAVFDSALPPPPGFIVLDPGVDDFGMPLHPPAYSNPEDAKIAQCCAIQRLLDHSANPSGSKESLIQTGDQERISINSNLVGVPPLPPQQQGGGEFQDDEDCAGYQLQEGCDGYYLKPLKSGKALRTTNFIIKLEEVRHRIVSDEEEEFEHQKILYRVCLMDSARAIGLEIAANQLSRIVEHVRRRVPEGTIFRNRAVFIDQLDILLRTQLAHCRNTYEYRVCGWMQIPQHGLVYVHDDLPATDTILFRSGFFFGKGLQPRPISEVVEAGFGILQFSDNLLQSAILFLWAHLGLMWTLFNQAGYPPRTLLYLSGVSGSLKTAVCKMLFNFTAVPELDIPASFRDTSASMEVSIDRYKDRVLLVDDFCPAANQTARRTMEQTLESLIRFYGDGNTKGRADPRMDTVHMKKAQGLCVITGEDVAGSLSSRLRCLFLHVEKDTFHGEVLKQFQEAPYLWSEYLACFVDALPSVIPDVVERIQAQFPLYRAQGERVLQERRLIDTYCCLAITARLTLEVASKLSGADWLSQWLTQMEDAVLTACVASEQQSTQQLPERIFSQTLITLLQRQDVRLGTKEEFTEAPRAYLGVSYKRYWYLWPQETYQAVVNYYNAGGGQFPLSANALCEALVNSGILIPAQISRDGQTHYENGTKISFAGRPRLWKIDPAVVKRVAEGE